MIFGEMVFGKILFNSSTFLGKPSVKSENTSESSSSEEIVDSTEYNPEKNCYHPLKHACWRHKERWTS